MANSFLKSFKKAFNNYLDEYAIEIQKQVVKNINDGKDFERKPFKKLSKATKDDRERRGYGRNKPILIRTGGLRDSITTKANKSTKSVELSSSKSYADNLNDGDHNQGYPMSPRKFFECPKSLTPGSSRDKAILNRHFDILEDEIFNNINARLKEKGIMI